MGSSRDACSRNLGRTVLSGPTSDSLGIINKFGVMLHAHINPQVHSGDIVSRYDQIGTIVNGEGNHVHVQFGMDDTSSDAANILTMFTTMKPEDILKNPLKGEPVPISRILARRQDNNSSTLDVVRQNIGKQNMGSHSTISTRTKNLDVRAFSKCVSPDSRRLKQRSSVRFDSAQSLNQPWL